jgi:hypothetical protein
MLEQKYRDYLIRGYERFVATKDRTHIDDAIRLVKTMSPSDFFQGDKDLNLEKRVFFHEPFGARWSGTYIKKYGSK